MKSYIQPGDTVTLTAPSGGLLSGQGAVIEAIFGIAAADAAEGDPVELVTRGVFSLPKEAAAFTEGQQVWWDDTAKAAQATSAVGDFPIGAAVEAAASGDATVKVRLDGVATAAL